MEITSDMLKGTVTPLSQKDFAQGKIFSSSWNPNMKYAWDDGVAISRYLKELKEGRIIAKKCDECNRILVPPHFGCRTGLKYFMSVIEPSRSAFGFQTAFTFIPMEILSGSTSSIMCRIPIPFDAPSRSMTAGV